MRKIIAIIVLSFVLSACGSEECNCGTIANDGIDNNPDGSTCFWLEIRSDCTGNKKKFCFDQDIWMNNHVGDNFCVTNESGW